MAAQQQAKARRKHVRRGLVPRPTTAEDVGGQSRRAQYRAEFSPVGAVLSAAQFGAYGRSLSEGEVIRASLIEGKRFTHGTTPPHKAPMAVVPPLATDPVLAYADEEQR